ncbi:MAG: tRNA 2-thiouridine(34) synthase MnmA, partial [Oscillospiraceae bacterium]|nr:tRNA 2-thiouridine(34) synthase MnmA [Oscillospiraceae bacterium]
MKHVLVGMSGGVDSSVAALLLLEQYQVSGATMKLFDSGDIVTEGKTCCAITDVEDARRVCHVLGIDHHVFNFVGQFREEVMGRFADGYARGETPNPCIDCNRFVKFPELLRRGDQLGIDYIAMGHYARIRHEDGRYLLLRGADREKDQSYVLYGMTQGELSRTLFPLGDMTKAEIRGLAEAHGLVTADKPDSQDICFV